MLFRSLDLTHGQMVNYIGNYDYYMEHVDEQMNRLFGVNGNLSNATLSAGTYKYADSENANSIANDDNETLSGNHSNTLGTSNVSASTQQTGALDWKAQKEAQSKKRKLEAALKKCEDEIAKLEARDSEINELLADPSIGTDLAKLRKLSDEQAEIGEKLSVLYDEWAGLQE